MPRSLDEALRLASREELAAPIMCAEALVEAWQDCGGVGVLTVEAVCHLRALATRLDRLRRPAPVEKLPGRVRSDTDG
jgi:hypothetical protein